MTEAILSALVILDLMSSSAMVILLLSEVDLYKLYLSILSSPSGLN